MFRSLGSVRFDWSLFLGVVPLLAAGLVTMYSFDETSVFFTRQLTWITVAFGVFVLASMIDFRFLRETRFIVVLYVITVLLLAFLFVLGITAKGATSWYDFGFLAFQPADIAKLVLILTLAKYFSRRHTAIGDVRHILISGAYAFILFLLIFLQPDFGSAVIMLAIWFGMVLVSGISKKHIFILFGLAVLSGVMLWAFVFTDIQKERIETFVHPYTDISGAGYNAHQSMIAVGSGGLLGKGIGYGTQSRLQFLPEYESDFIFAAFAEEWGYGGAILLFCFIAFVIWRILGHAREGASNFETLFAVGYAVMLLSHVTIHIGTNIGLLPVTGLTMPFMSYGGSHLIAEFLGLGILTGMSQYKRPSKEEFQRPNLLEEL